MKLRTSLQLSAVFPIAFAIVMTIVLTVGQKTAGDISAVHSLLLAIIGILGLAMTAVILLYSRDILSKIGVLNNWIDNVINGNLDSKIQIAHGDDEVGRLSTALSKMLAELKNAYADIHKQALSQEQLASEYKKHAEASQVGSKHLSQALSRFKDTQEESVKKERLRILEQVLRGVIHDFSEELMPILGTAELLSTEPSILDNRDETLQHVETIRSAVQQARRSLRNLAGFFHPGEDAVTPVDLNHVVQQAVSRTRPQWKDDPGAKGITIELRTDLGVIPSIAGNEGDLQNTVVDLITNSVESMKSDGTITIATQVSGNNVTLEIRDTGQGMTPAVQKRCCEPFYSTKSAAGTGMGLTVVSGTVRRHKGKLNIETQPGTGTRVIVSLPVWKQETGIEQAEAPALKDLKIIIMDDDLWSREVVSRILVRQGHKVESAISGEEGLQKIADTDFDVAIVDRAMPGMGGDEVAAKLKGISSEMPVIMLTGFGNVMINEGDVPENVDLVVPKPTSSDELKRALATVMR